MLAQRPVRQLGNVDGGTAVNTGRAASVDSGKFRFNDASHLAPGSVFPKFFWRLGKEKHLGLAPGGTRWNGRLIIVNAPPNVSSRPIARSMLALRLTTDRSPDASSSLLRPRKISPQGVTACRPDWTPPADALASSQPAAAPTRLRSRGRPQLSRRPSKTHHRAPQGASALN
jgi:hypothetical protein